MINLLQAIINRIDELFPKKQYPNISIYVNNVEQGLKEPCFFIDIVNTSIKRVMNNRYWFNNSVNIVYLNQKANKFELQHTKERLLLGLGHIVLGTGYNDEFKESGGIYGYNIEANTEEDSISILANYDYLAKIPVVPDPNMIKNTIRQYTEEEPYKEVTEKTNLGMWETKDLPDKETVFPKINPLDDRYVEQNDKMWEVNEENDVMRKKELNIYGKDQT